MKKNNQKTKDLKKEYMELKVMMLMLKKDIGYFTSFQKISQYPLETQYQFLTELSSCLDQKRNQK